MVWFARDVPHQIMRDYIEDNRGAEEKYERIPTDESRKFEDVLAVSLVR